MKKLLLTLLLFFGSIISFGYCSISQTNINNYNLQYVTTLTWSDMNSTNFSYIMPDNNTYCLSIDNGIVIGSSNLQISSAYCNNNVCTTQGTLNNFNGYRFFNTSTNITFYNNILKLVPSTTTTDLNNLYSDNFICYTPYSGYLSNAIYTFMDTAYLRGVSSSNSPNLSVSVYKVINSNNCPTCEICEECETCEEQYTSSQCQTEYNLIPISFVDSSYCITNGLCPSSSGSGEDLTGLNWSALYINDIQHLGKPIINITIPQEIDWDYVSTGDYFDLNVSGLNGDEEYIQGIIDINSYRPTSEDFTNVFVSGLTLIFPYIIIALFIVFVRKLIKKIFK